MKKIREGKSGGMRTETRYNRLGWMNDAETDLRNMGVKMWRKGNLFRTEWATLTGETKEKKKKGHSAEA